MNAIIIIISILSFITICYLSYRIYTIKKGIASIPVQSVIIGTRIDFTSNDEISLASNKPAVSLLIKLLDQEVSIAVAELTSLNTKGDKVCEIQGKIDGFIHLRGRLITMKNKKTSE